MKILILLALLSILGFLNTSQAQNTAQDSLAKNTVYIGVGSMLICSHINVNYERVLFKNTNRKFIKTLTLRANVNFMKGYFCDSNSYMGVELVGLQGKSNHHLELMLGAASTYNKEGYQWHRNGFKDENGLPLYKRTDFIYVYPTLSVGYRFQRPTRGFFFRTGLGFPEGVFIGSGYTF